MGTAKLDDRITAQDIDSTNFTECSPQAGLVPRALVEIFRQIEAKTSERNTYKVDQRATNPIFC